jgi:hypothetical protein
MAKLHFSPKNAALEAKGWLTLAKLLFSVKTQFSLMYNHA